MPTQSDGRMRRNFWARGIPGDRAISGNAERRIDYQFPKPPFEVRRSKLGVRRSHLLSLVLIPLALFTGCAASNSGEGQQGPHDPVSYVSSAWSYEDDPGVQMRTPHYAIFTTIRDDSFRRDIAQTMEGALAQYERVAPGVPAGGPDDKPLDCYVFANRDQWRDYTRSHIPPVEAMVYLQINRGGYTRGDVYVAYDCDRRATTSIAAHEGWHQFASRHFKGRLPPFLEEGIATMFEDIEWDNGLPRWNISRNRSRLQAIHAAVEGNYAIPLDELLRLHAGNVVALSGNRIEAFYAGSWAFATFLWAADDGKYRPMLRRMISDIADGTVYDPTGVHANAALPWNPEGVRPMLEHYLQMPFDQINAEYKKYITKVAFDEFASQWNN
jgi:hypothetical protein